MNARALRALIRKDISVALRTRFILVPMVLLPLIIFVGLPLLGSLTTLAPQAGGDAEAVADLLSVAPEAFQAQLAGQPTSVQMAAVSLVYLLAPLYLIVPMMVASAIAADSFAGERERDTLEPLLHSPLTDGELFLAKALTPFLPGLAVALVGSVIYQVTADLVLASMTGVHLFPNLMWVLLTLWVAPAVAGLGLSSMVLISSKVGTFQEAFQLGGLVVLPVVGLLIGQTSGLLFLSPGVVVLIGAGVWAIDGLLLWFGAGTFQRSSLGITL